MSNVILEKSKGFAIRIVRLCQYLKNTKREKDLSRQLLRSGTSVGANVREAIRAQSKKDFISKMNIALKEAYESEYWIEILFDTGYLKEKEFKSIVSDCNELNKLLIVLSLSELSTST